MILARVIASAIATEPSSGALTVPSSPPSPPIGVLAAPAITIGSEFIRYLSSFKLNGFIILSDTYYNLLYKIIFKKLLLNQ